jgi:hypothetical protein
MTVRGASVIGSPLLYGEYTCRDVDCVFQGLDGRYSPFAQVNCLFWGGCLCVVKDG